MKSPIKPLRLLCLLLSIVMVVSALAALPAGAQENVYQSTFDGSLSTQEFGLVVTEFCINTSISNPQSSAVDTDADAYRYIEIYNGSDKEVDLYSLSILYTQEKITSASGWKRNKDFSEGKKLDLKGGNIFASQAGLTGDALNKYQVVENPSTAILEPGKIAVIWLWNSASEEVSKNGGVNLARAEKGRYTFPLFRDHYAKLAGIDTRKNADGSFVSPAMQAIEDTLIIAACAHTTANKNAFDLRDNYGAVFALADNTFVIGNSIDDNIDDGNNLYCEFGYVVNGRQGVGWLAQDVSFMLVPANSSPDLYNAVVRMEKSLISEEEAAKYVDAVDYVQIGNKYLSYREMAHLSIDELPSPGSMPAIQWTYIDADGMANAVAAGKTGVVTDWAEDYNSVIKGEGDTLVENWAAKAVDAAIAVRVIRPEDAPTRPGYAPDPEPVYTAQFDGTKSTQEFGLVVTEFCVDTSISNPQNSEVNTDADAYRYIEIYNGSDKEIDLYSLSLLYARESSKDSEYWKKNKDFRDGKKLDLKNGNIFASQAGLKGDALNKYQVVQNPQTAILEPGKIAVIWLWNSASEQVSKDGGVNLAKLEKGRNTFPLFRDHYAKLAGIDTRKNADGSFVSPEMQAIEDTLIIAACAHTTANKNAFDLKDDYGAVFALADNTFVIGNSIDDNIEAGSNLYCEFGYVVNGRQGMGKLAQDGAAVLVPANSSPDYYNAIKRMERSLISEEHAAEYVDAVDYVQIGGKYLSYREMAYLLKVAMPSIGSMPSYQWAYIDADGMAEAVAAGKTGMVTDWAESYNSVIKGEGNALVEDWETLAINNLISQRVIAPPQAEARMEVAREIELKDQDWWEKQQGFNASRGIALTDQDIWEPYNTYNNQPSPRNELAPFEAAQESRTLWLLLLLPLLALPTAGALWMRKRARREK